MRKLKRAIAHRNMKKAGYIQVNKVKTDRSFFAKNWRDFVKVA